MKRAKSTKVTIEKYIGEAYTVKCPHCKNVCQGGFGRDTVRLRCYICKEEILLKW